MFNNCTKNKRLIFFILALAFRALIDIAYYFWISPYYQYQGLEFKPGTILGIITTCALVLATSVFVPDISSRPSNFIIGFLYLVSYIPATSLTAFAEMPLAPLLWLTLVFLFLFFLSNIQFKINCKFPGTYSIFMLLFVFGIYLVSLLVLYAKYGLRLPSAIFDIYETRAEYKESLKEGGELIGYFLNWVGSIITPFIAVWSLINRKMIIFSIAILSQTYSFAIGGHKSHFFALLFITWLLYGVKYFRNNLLNYTVFSFSILVSISTLMDCIINEPVFNGIYTRRLFFMPAQLFYYYYDFFSHNPHTYLSQSIAFKWLIDYPYDLPIPNLIADYYLASWKTSANANMWADAYASFGILGMFIYAIPLWLIINIIDSISHDKNIYFTYALIAMPLFSLTNSSLQTTMITHGMFLSIIILILMPKSQNNFLAPRQLQANFNS